MTAITDLLFPISAEIAKIETIEDSLTRQLCSGTPISLHLETNLLAAIS